MNFIIIDGFVDEPTCLGVPPYVSTYVRYAAGAAALSGISEIDYVTIEELRREEYILDKNKHYDTAVIIAGNPVPGKYLGGIPLKSGEIDKIGSRNPGTLFFAGGPIQFSQAVNNFPNVKMINLDIESYLYDYFKGGNPRERYRTLEELDRFSKAGAFILQKHPRYPEIIAEIETGRGCPRLSHCSFCIEGNFKVEFRTPGAVIEEMRELYRNGIKHFRLGKQADLYAYGSEMKEWKNGFSRPDPGAIRELYEGIRSSIPDIKTLHLDNVNPGTLANFPDESYRITEIIAGHNTPGDVAALGMESADPDVIKSNFLKASPAEVMKAVEIINAAGGAREGSLPKLLPGINLIRGLMGESKDTFKMNYEFLLDVLNKGYLLRRINIRQIRVSPGTILFEKMKPSRKEEKILDAVFRNYREKIRNEIDMPMIKKVFPAGTVIQNVIVETRRGDWSIARPIGTYPIAVNIPKILPLLSKVSVFIIGYRERSVVGLTKPFILKNASLQELKQIPGFSRKAGEIISKRDPEKGLLASSPIFEDIKDLIL